VQEERKSQASDGSRSKLGLAPAATKPNHAAKSEDLRPKIKHEENRAVTLCMGTHFCSGPAARALSESRGILSARDPKHRCGGEIDRRQNPVLTGRHEIWAPKIQTEKRSLSGLTWATDKKKNQKEPLAALSARGRTPSCTCWDRSRHN
jgi:hypothetical protein